MDRREFLRVETVEEAWVLVPWACEIVPVEGGFMAFENARTLTQWQNQQ